MPRTNQRDAVLCLLWMVGAALLLPACETARKPENVAPTAADRALVLRLEKAMSDAANLPQARHSILDVRAEPNQEKIDRLTGALPATAAQMRRARRDVGNIASAIEASHHWKPAPVYKIARRRGEIVIDGRAIESAWSNARPMTLRFSSDITETAQPPFAEARFLWDETHLYVVFDVPDDTVYAPRMERDGPVYTADCVELFVMPSKEAARYWEVDVSPTGAVFDQLCHRGIEAPRADCDRNTDLIALRHSAQVRGSANEADDTDEGYTVEIALPFDALPDMDAPPRAGMRLWLLAAHAARNASSEPLRFYSHAQMIGSFGNIWTLPRMELVDTIK